jgi:hypothetical protein
MSLVPSYNMVVVSGDPPRDLTAELHDVLQEVDPEAGYNRISTQPEAVPALGLLLELSSAVALLLAVDYLHSFSSEMGRQHAQLLQEKLAQVLRDKWNKDKAGRVPEISLETGLSGSTYLRLELDPDGDDYEIQIQKAIKKLELAAADEEGFIEAYKRYLRAHGEVGSIQMKFDRESHQWKPIGEDESD